MIDTRIEKERERKRKRETESRQRQEDQKLPVFIKNSYIFSTLARFSKRSFFLNNIIISYGPTELLVKGL